MLALYRLLLLCYPTRFRRRFGPEMTAAFAAYGITGWAVSLRRSRGCRALAGAAARERRNRSPDV